MLAERRGSGFFAGCLTALSFLLSWLMLGQLAGLLLDSLARWQPCSARFNVGTLRPASFRELLEIYNRYNFRHVKVVGYNNGVNHFGHRYPGKTVVSTVSCHRTRLAGADLLKADCGATVRRALDFLSPAGQRIVRRAELFLRLPRHRLLRADPRLRGRFLHHRRDDHPARPYDPRGDRIRASIAMIRRFASASTISPPTCWCCGFICASSRRRVISSARRNWRTRAAPSYLMHCRDSRAANVEIRKASADATAVPCASIYHDPGDSPSPVLELPRDTLGRLWDRLEENWLTSYLMHASDPPSRLARRIVFHGGRVHPFLGNTPPSCR